MSTHYILSGREAVPAKLLEWAKWFETADRHVAKTEVATGIVVSTVFLGLDHRFGCDGPPLLFETMVFDDYGDDGTQERYSTWAEAEAGHQRIVAEKQALLRKVDSAQDG